MLIYKLVKEYPNSCTLDSVAIQSEINKNVFEVFNSNGLKTERIETIETLTLNTEYWAKIYIKSRDVLFSKSFKVFVNEKEFERFRLLTEHYHSMYLHKSNVRPVCNLLNDQFFKRKQILINKNSDIKYEIEIPYSSQYIISCIIGNFLYNIDNNLSIEDIDFYKKLLIKLSINNGEKSLLNKLKLWLIKIKRLLY